MKKIINKKAVKTTVLALVLALCVATVGCADNAEKSGRHEMGAVSGQGADMGNPPDGKPPEGGPKGEKPDGEFSDRGPKGEKPDGQPPQKGSQDKKFDKNQQDGDRQGDVSDSSSDSQSEQAQ